jgi:hypothetical protein
MWQFIKNIFGKKPTEEVNNSINSTTDPIESVVVNTSILKNRELVIGNYCIKNTKITDVLIVDIPCLDIINTSKLVFEIDVNAKVTLMSIDDKKSIKIMVTALEDLPSIMNVKYKEI